MPIHPFLPSGLTPDSKILILGSFPSVASREMGFYYAHPQNRFWKVLVASFDNKSNQSIDSILSKTLPKTNLQSTAKMPYCQQHIVDKTTFLKSHSLVLWDIVQSCEIQGSSDSSLRSVVFNDIFALLTSSNIQTICLNGTKATMLFRQYCKAHNFPLRIQTHPNYKILIPIESFAQKFGREIAIFSLPSTSPANARCSFDNLLSAWKILLET